MSEGRRRVVVTGIGAVTPVGFGESALWDGVVRGRSAIAPIRAFDTGRYRVKIGAEVDDESLAAAVKARGRRPADRALDLVIEAAGQALDQAALDEAERNVTIIIGSGVGPATALWTSFTRFAEKGPRGLRPTTVPRCMANSFSAEISIHFGLTGPNYVVVSACSSSTNAIGDAFRRIRNGYAETAVCGGTESYFDPFYYGVWNNLGVLSTIEDPARAYRPFDADRDGCLLGEGAGVLVLESLERATERGARIRGEILGYGESSDATHITNPSVEGQVAAMRGAMRSAGVAAADIGFVNAHGTATIANDETESESIRAALGQVTSAVPVGANKSYFGHLLGASGAVETIVTLLGLERRTVPPNLNLDRPDPKCDLALVGPEPMRIEAPIAMKNSFGFGGGNAVLVLKRYDP